MLHACPSLRTPKTYFPKDTLFLTLAFISSIGPKLCAADLSSMNVIPWETGQGIEATMRHQSSFSAHWHRFTKSLEL